MMLQDDLAALRAHLGPFIEYLEADLMVFSTIRGLTNSQEQANNDQNKAKDVLCAVGCEGWHKTKVDTGSSKIRGSEGYSAQSSVSSW
jgi:hypothetical protein